MITELLKKIVKADEEGSILYLQEEDTIELVYAGLVEINASMTDVKGAIATRPTEKGKNTVEDSYKAGELEFVGEPEKEVKKEVKEESDKTFNDNAEDEPVKTGVVKPSPLGGFEIESGIPVPAGRRGTKRGCRYPFDKLEEVGQSFHVAPSDKTPNPTKSLASTVSGANKRMEGVRFVVRAVYESDPKGAGARVFRVE